MKNGQWEKKKAKCREYQLVSRGTGIQQVSTPWSSMAGALYTDPKAKPQDSYWYSYLVERLMKSSVNAL